KFVDGAQRRRRQPGRCPAARYLRDCHGELLLLVAPMLASADGNARVIGHQLQMTTAEIVAISTGRTVRRPQSDDNATDNCAPNYPPNADGLEGQSSLLMDATAVIDEQTNIKP